MRLTVNICPGNDSGLTTVSGKSMPEEPSNLVTLASDMAPPDPASLRTRLSRISSSTLAEGASRSTASSLAPHKCLCKKRVK